MTVRTSSAPTIDDDDDATRWFDETFARSVKPISEPAPETFEDFMQDIDDRAEHTALLASFGRLRRPAATAQIDVKDEDKP